MRAGLFLAYWPWFTPQEQVELAVLADELGLDSVWISEAWGQDAVSVLGLLAARPSGSRSARGCSRSPRAPPRRPRWRPRRSTCSPAGASGSGSACPGPQVSEGWYGVPFERPVARTREYVEIVRTALARKTWCTRAASTASRSRAPGR